jgi:peptide/nickel transport system permease protein
MLGNSVRNVVIAIAIAYSPFFIRLVRSQMITAREAEYARAARCVGNPPFRIMTYHLLPNCLGPSVVQGTLCLGWAILDAAGLSFLGLGIRPPTPEWGVLVAEGTQYVNSGQWWISVFPGLMIVLAVFGFNLIGDRLRRAVG